MSDDLNGYSTYQKKDGSTAYVYLLGIVVVGCLSVIISVVNLIKEGGSTTVYMELGFGALFILGGVIGMKSMGNRKEK